MPVPEQSPVGDTMQVICTDGTVLQCQRFEAIDSGVLLFDERRAGETEEDAEEEAEDEEAMAFVPLHQLRFVLPEGVQLGRAGGQATGQATPQQAPQATGSTPPQGGMPPQQSAPGQPSPPQQGFGQPPSGSGSPPGR